ncbi:rifampicin phosphotransferase-like isoform X2 [Pelodiscus sinensis]|uniref:rifampicin phosphotransferase-like isoform X2 n=1 Tax=Pelodiscus sinensis TaxID=13735 RepID=UPI003F6C0F93
MQAKPNSCREWGRAARFGNSLVDGRAAEGATGGLGFGIRGSALSVRAWKREVRRPESLGPSAQKEAGSVCSQGLARAHKHAPHQMLPDLLSLLLALLCLVLAWRLLWGRAGPAGPVGSRRYSVPGRGFQLKKWALRGLFSCAFRRRQRARGRPSRREQMGLGAGQEALFSGAQPRHGAEEQERLQELVHDAHALDSVYLTGFTETDKTFVITRLGRRPNGLCEMWLFLRVDGIGEFEHPVHPDMMVSDESEKCWRGGGLMIECLEPHRRWKIKFNGLLRKGPYRHQWNEEEGELVHVKFSFHWTSFSDVFDFQLDSHPKAFAEAFALEEWSAEFFKRVQKDGEQQSRYEQWGQSVGEIEIEGHEKKEILLRGVRSHSYGIRNWAEIYRYVMILMHCEDGTSAHLTVISIPATTTHFAVGYVLFPNGKKAGIDWSNASLADMADDGMIRDIYRVSFTAGGKFFDIRATLDKQARPVVYNGLTGTGIFHECIADFRLNLTIRGWGLVEFYYRDAAGQLSQNSGFRWKEPSLPPTSEFVVSFTEEHSQCPRDVGGKGAQLGQLTYLQKQLGNKFIVPEGFCVTVLTLEHQMKQNHDLQEAVRELTEVACKIKPGNLQELCKRCSDLFRATTLSSEIEDAILQQLEELGLQQEHLVVRSSVVGEDTTAMSAAGQLYTELEVRGSQQVCEGIQICWASLYSFAAVQYRRQRGQPIPARMGVVIQRMVPADAAGELFTCDPVTGHPGKMVISASCGLREAKGSDCAEPDTITLRHSPKCGLHLTSKKMGSKPQGGQLRAGGGTAEDDCPTEAQRCCISEDTIMKLAGLALQVGKAHGTARNIEWTVKENVIYFLQDRPVTAFDLESEFELMHEFDSGFPSDYQWLTTANISETAPGAVTPLMWAVFGRALQYAAQQFCVHSGGLDGLKPYSFRCLDMYCGHLFLNIMSIAVSFEQANLVYGKNKALCFLIEQELPELSSYDLVVTYGELPMWRKILNSFKSAMFLLSNIFRQRHWFKQLQTFRIPSGSNATEAYLHIDRLLPEYSDALLTSLMCSAAFAMWPTYLLSTLSQGENHWTPEAMAAMAVLCHTCSDSSVELPRAVEAIIQAVRDQGKSAEFITMDPQAAVSWLLSSDSGEAGKTFQSFLEKHGFHSFGEADLRAKPWADDPAQLIPLLQKALERGQVSKKKAQTSVEEAIAAIKAPVTGLRKFILPFLVRKAREGISKREHSKDLAMKVYALFKTAYWALAKHMVEECFLPDEDLLFFLTHLEIGEVLRCRSADIVLRASRRRQILDHQMALQFPEVNVARPVPLQLEVGATLTGEAMLSGVIISHGVAKGTARVLKTIQEVSSIKQGDILIVTTIGVGWTSCFPLLGGLVTEIGGVLSRGAVIARDYGLPCIMKCKGATSYFKSGDRVILDGFKGTVQKIEA